MIRCAVPPAIQAYYIGALENVKRSLLNLGLACILLLSGCYGDKRPQGIGSAAPAFIVRDSDREVTLRQFRGQVVVLNFWASWCPPCIEETPSLVTMQKHLKQNGVTVLAVSIDEDEQAYHRFVKEYGINFVTVRDPSQRLEHLTALTKSRKPTSLTAPAY
jgi:cytochrome c biogenesis protein CcmG/thiol:disulfide interchange protein DsbE